MNFRNDISSEYLRRRLDYDAVTGAFTWRQKPGDDRATRSWNAQRAGNVAGTADRRTGYLLIKMEGRPYMAHRLAWLYVTGDWPADEIDHRDNDKLANAFGNLRQATRAQNAANRPAPRNSPLGLKGVRAMGNKFEAGIKVAGKRIHLGTYETAAEASNAYAAAAKKSFGQFARTA